MKLKGLLFAATLVAIAAASCSKEEQGGGGTAVTYISSSNSSFTATDDGGRIVFKSSGGSVIIFVDYASDWYVQNNASDFFAVEADLRQGTATVTAGQNLLERELEGTMEFKSSDGGVTFATVGITQNAYGAPELTVGSAEWRAPAFGDGLTTEIAVSSTLGDYDVTTTKEKWLTVAKTDSGISLTVSENGDMQTRTSTVTLTADDGRLSDSADIVVTQDGVAYVTLETDWVVAPTAGGTISVAADSDFDLEWDVDSDASWLTVGTDAAGLVLTVAENDTGSDRETVVAVIVGDGAQNNAEARLTVYQEADNPDSFILEYSIQTAGQQVTLPLGGTVDCTVNWGDGTVEKVFSAYPSHTFPEGRIFDVTVTGTVTKLYSKDLDDLSRTLLTGIVQWGDTGLEDISYAVYKTNVKYLPADTRGAFSKLTSLDYAFRECDSLTEVSEDLLAYCGGVTSLRFAFYYCTGLESLPEGLLSACTSAADCYCLFGYCTSLTDIPGALFANCPKITDLSFAFQYCSGLSSLPEGLFASCPNVASFSAAFQYVPLQEIPAGLFSANTKAQSFQFTFAGARITEIPAGLFDSCRSATSFSCTFYQCPYLETVPAGLFGNCPNVTDFGSVFQYCSKIKSIPSGLFDGCTKATTVASAFWNCGLVESIPDGLFDDFSSVTDFGGVFCYCSSITYVPDDLFKNCVSAKSFKYAFQGCSSMTSLPSMSACVAAEDFQAAFALTSITEIPTGYFDSCVNATSFYSVFAHDTGLTAIPEGLFDKCTRATDFQYAFSLCTGLNSIPEGLFAKCPDVEVFSGVFDSCTGLTGIPAGLFDANTKATYFDYAFNGCTGLTGESPYTVVGGTKVHLYQRQGYSNYFSKPTHYGSCFTSCDGLSDADDIASAGWN